MKTDFTKAFAAIEMTEAEEKQGYTISEATKAVLINLRADYASDLMMECLKYKCGSEEEKVDLAYKKGALDVLTDLLARCANVMQDAELKEIAESLKQDQPEI